VFKKLSISNQSLDIHFPGKLGFSTSNIKVKFCDLMQGKAAQNLYLALSVSQMINIRKLR